MSIVLGMTTTVTIDGNVITPTFIDGIQTRRLSGNVMHPVLGSSVVDATYRPAKLRTGTLRMGFSTEASALLAESYHATGTVAVVASSESNQIVMKYVVNGSITLTLDEQTRAVWILEVDFQEVPA